MWNTLPSLLSPNFPGLHLNNGQSICNMFTFPGWVLPFLGMVGRFCSNDPRFGDFQSDCVLFYISTQSDWPLFPQKKISFSLSHLVPEILELKVVYIFTKMYYLPILMHFVSLFSLIFNPIEPFFIDFRSFWPSFSQSVRSDWVHVFVCVEPGYWQFGEVPPPPAPPGTHYMLCLVQGHWHGHVSSFFYLKPMFKVDIINVPNKLM